MEELTQKEEKVIEYILQGDDKITAVQKAFNCKNRNVARSYASRLFRKEKVAKRLAEVSEKVSDKLFDKTKTFLELLLRYVSMEQIAKKLADNLLSNDKRVSDSALEKAMRVISAYPKEEFSALDGSNFQIVMVRGKEEFKTLEGNKEEPIMIVQKSGQENGEVINSNKTYDNNN